MSKKNLAFISVVFVTMLFSSAAFAGNLGNSLRGEVDLTSGKGDDENNVRIRGGFGVEGVAGADQVYDFKVSGLLNSRPGDIGLALMWKIDKNSLVEGTHLGYGLGKYFTDSKGRRTFVAAYYGDGGYSTADGKLIPSNYTGNAVTVVLDSELVKNYMNLELSGTRFNNPMGGQYKEVAVGLPINAGNSIKIVPEVKKREVSAANQSEGATVVGIAFRAAY